MKQIVKPEKQKQIIIFVAAAVSLLGLEASSSAMASYQLESFLVISAYVYFFLVFWQSFVFDLHLKPASAWASLEKTFLRSLKARFQYMASGHHFRHYQSYLVLPGIIYWATAALIFLNPFNSVLKQVFIFTSSIGLTISFLYLKTVFYAHKEQNHLTRQMIFMVKLYAAYISFLASFGICLYLGLGKLFFAILVADVTFVLLAQAFFQHHFLGFDTLKYLLSASVILGVTGYFVFMSWNVNYFSGALVLAAIYNTIWGFFHHDLIDKNLTREIVYEYVAVLFVVLVFVFGTTNFAQRI